MPFKPLLYMRKKNLLGSMFGKHHGVGTVSHPLSHSAGTRYDPVAGLKSGHYGVGFDGASYFTLASHTIADSDSLTFQTWFKTPPAWEAGASHQIYRSFSGKINIACNPTGVLDFLVFNTSGGLAIFANSTGVLPNDEWIHINFSLRTNGIPKACLRVNGEDRLSIVSGITPSTLIDFTDGAVGIGASDAGTSTIRNGGLTQLWMRSGLFYDLDTQAFRELFYDANNSQGGYIDHGEDGAASVFNTPSVYYDLRTDQVSDFIIGRGTDAGDLTINGTPHVIQGMRPKGGE